MSTETPPKERSVPKPVFTDAEAGSQEFTSSTSRSFNYFTPVKRRASVYEDVTVDVLVLGIGINVSQRAVDLPGGSPGATSLAVEGAEVDRAALLAGVLEQLERRYDEWVSAAS